MGVTEWDLQVRYRCRHNPGKLYNTFCYNTYLTKDQPPPSNLVVYSTIQCSIMCVCVFFPFILDIKFIGRTSRGHTGFLIHLLSAVRALIVYARRIQPFLSLVDREVEFCVLTI